MQIIKVQYYSEDNRLSDRSYTYYSEDELEVGDIITVPVRDTITKAKVSAIDVPEAEIVAFKDKVKTIPAGSIEIAHDENEGEPMFEPESPHLSQPDTDATPEPVEVKLELAGDAYMVAGKAIIKVNPESDTSILSLLCEANKVRDYALARVIATDADLSPATEDLSLIAKLKKALTEKKAEYYKPIKAHLDAVSASFQTILTPVEEADKITRDKIMAYRAEQVRKAREAEEINRLRMEAARKEMELKGELTEDVNLVETPPPPVHKVQTELGTASTMKVRKWEVVDITKVPADYLMVNSALLSKVVKAGIPAIPGIKIWEEETLRINTK